MPRSCSARAVSCAPVLSITATEPPDPNRGELSMLKSIRAALAMSVITLTAFGASSALAEPL
ncbi:MAG: hypothetical protein E5V16_08555, partial [Mesorhizobium sp.]